MGYRVALETNPRKALGAFRSQPDAFDLVITDQAMPYLQGTLFCQETLTIRPDIPVILCRGYSEQVDGVKAPALG